jgi:hypothetical protein
MGKSARVLGWEFGRTARDMNALLKEHGYLYGEPGAYGLTEKGKQYGDEQYHDNGYGGYAARSWEIRTWNDDTAAALKADMEANPGGSAAAESQPTEESLPEEMRAVEYEPPVSYGGSYLDPEPELTWKGYAIVGALIGGIILAPHVKPLWNTKVKPAAKRVQNKFSKKVSAGQETPESSEDPR